MSDRPAEARPPGPRTGPASFPKRFYTRAAVAPRAGAFEILLDGRPARTPGRNPLALPTEALAEAVRREWDAVETTIDPRIMPLTRLVNTAIDGVSRMRSEVLAEVVRFAESDLLAYRAAEPHDLVEAQRKAWDPVIEWARDELGAPMILVEGINHVPQPPRSLDRIAEHLAALSGEGQSAPFRVAALHVMTTLTGSALLAAAIGARHLDAGAAWSAAHVDEDYEIERWGVDEEASLRRSTRWTEMRAAASLFALTADDLDESGAAAGQPV